MALGWPSDRVKGASLETNRELRQVRELIPNFQTAQQKIEEFCRLHGAICGEIWIGASPDTGVPTLDLILRAK
jgi:hypothetical protein